MGLVQFERYSEMLKKREEYVAYMNKAIDDLNANLDTSHQVAYLNHKAEDHCSSHHLYLVRLQGRTREEANHVIGQMAERGIATNVHYKPLPMMTAYMALGFDIKYYPNAYNLFENEITLPLNTCMTMEDVEYVMENFVDIVKFVVSYWHCANFKNLWKVFAKLTYTFSGLKRQISLVTMIVQLQEKTDNYDTHR